MDAGTIRRPRNTAPPEGVIPASTSALVARMGHTLRTPLNAILGYTEILGTGVAGPVAERQSRYLSSIEDAATELSGFVNDLIALGTVEDGRAEMEFTWCKVTELFESAIGDAPAPDRESLTGPPDPVAVDRIWGDSYWAAHMLRCVLLSARRASESGGVQIETSVGPVEGGSDRELLICVSISDATVPEDALRAGEGTAAGLEGFEKHSHGLGLRLMLARSIAHRHHGTLAVRPSTLDRFLALEVRIPIDPGPPADEPR